MNSLKAKFGKFAVSSETSRNVRGGNAPEWDPWDDGDGGNGGGTGPRWACTYHNKQHPHPRTQICPNESSANALRANLENNGFQVGCYCLC